MGKTHQKEHIWNVEKTKIFLIAGPSVLFLIFFLIIPFLILLRYSFFVYDPIKIVVPGIYTLRNYIHVFTELFYIDTIIKTIAYAFAVILVTMFLGYPLAYFLARTKLAIKKFLLTLVILPLTLSVVVLAFGWLVMLGTDGIVDRLLLSLHLTKEHAKLLYNPTVVVLALAQAFLPYQVLCLMNSFSSINPVLEDAAHSLGANGFRTFTKVLLPLTIPGLLAGSTFVAIGTITAFVFPRVLGGIGVSMLGSIIYEQTVSILNWPLGATLSVIMFVLTFIIFWFFTKILVKRVTTHYHIKG